MIFRKTTILIACSLGSVLSSCLSEEGKTPPENGAGEKYRYTHPIPFQPENYVCYQTDQPLLIDGKIEELAWEEAAWTSPFVDIEGKLKPAPPLRTRVKMLWDDQYFYVAARLKEPHVWARLSQRDTVIFHDDDFEVFIDPDGDGHQYYEFEVNALNTVWDLLLLRPYRVDRRRKVINNWNIGGLRSAVHIEGTLNQPADTDQYWSVEIAFPWAALSELAGTSAPPEDGDQWRVNFSRVDWHVVVENGTYVKRKDGNGKNLPEENWVWSPQGRISMHHPETWGYVQFSANTVGGSEVEFVEREQERIKWGLWQLHFQQDSFFSAHTAYTDDPGKLSIPERELGAYRSGIRLFTYPGGYQIVVQEDKGQRVWHINEQGRIWQTSEVLRLGKF